MTNIPRIKEYLASNSRNKIILHKETLTNVNYVDIGKSLASAIKNKSENKNLSLIAKEKLQTIIDEASDRNDEFGQIIALKNIGILFESELKFDFINLVENLSKSIPVFIEWYGDHDGENLHFLTKQKGINLNIKNISYIFI